MATGWVPDGSPAPAEHPAAGLRAERRERLARAFPGETVVVPSGQPPVRSNDTRYPFRPGTAFLWLVGSDVPGAVLVVADGDAVLYQPGPQDRADPAWFTDYHGERVDGYREPLPHVAARLRVDTRPLEDLGALAGATARVLRDLDDTVERLVVSDPEADAELRVWLDEQRLVKDPWEVAQIQEAVDMTVRGFEDVVRDLPEAVATSERYLEGRFFLRARLEGNDVGYGSICAAGSNACTLHYVRNDGPVRPGDLLLLDMGVENREFYTADVTRTLPVSGAFTARQRWVYDLVLRAQEAALALLRPGVPYDAPNAAAMAVLVEGLRELGLVGSDDVLAADDLRHKRWTVHRISHMLGLDVHDCSRAREERYAGGTYEEGMVLTVEPGLYFLPDDALVPADLRGIGVRIEDDVVITADGYRMLSDGLPRSADEVEAWMAALRSPR
jgi:Xaa-Pro aminopeptidase